MPEPRIDSKVAPRLTGWLLISLLLPIAGGTLLVSRVVTLRHQGLEGGHRLGMLRIDLEGSGVLVERAVHVRHVLLEDRAQRVMQRRSALVRNALRADLARLVRSQAANTVSQPSSLVRAVSSETLSTGV